MKLRLEDRHFSWNINGNLFNISEPKVMGIVNCTPDSFFSESRKTTRINIQQQIEKHLNEGADIIDIGGYSTRPGALEISEKEEIDRISVALEILKSHSNLPISIDTFRSEVAQFALDNGANIVNDISAGKLDQKMFKTISPYKAPMILMHLKGNPQTMQNECNYTHLFQDIAYYFSEQLSKAREEGLVDFAIDLGFGFSKTIDQNFELLQQLSDFQFLDLPILVGVSRKSMVYKTLEITPEEALNGTSALHMYSLMNGASILRAHDVKEAKEVVKLFQKIDGK